VNCLSGISITTPSRCGLLSG